MPVSKIAMPLLNVIFSSFLAEVSIFFYLLFYCSFIGGNLTYTQQTTSAECEAEGKGILVRLNWMISNKSQIVIVALRT